MMKVDDEDLEVFKLTPKDKDEVYDVFRRYYVQREPLCRGLHFEYDEYLPVLDTVSLPALSSGVSLGLRDKTTGVMVGFRLNRIISTPEEEEGIFPPGGFHNEKCNRYTEALCNLCKGVHIVSSGKYKKQLELLCLCIAPNYSNKGLGRQLIEMSEKMGKELGCDVATVQCLNAAAVHIYKKLGYREAKRVDVGEVLQKDGKSLLDDDAIRQTNDTTHFVYFLKEI